MVKLSNVSFPKMNKKIAFFEKTGKGPSPKEVNCPEGQYEEYQWALYLATFLALLGAFTCGHAMSLGLVLDLDLVFDLPPPKTRQFQFGMALYFILGQVAGASTARWLCNGLGPKKALVLGSVSFCLSWPCILQQLYLVNLILCARFFSGFSAGLVAICSLVYLFDISMVKSRASILSNFTMATLVGVYFPMLCTRGDAHLYTILVLAFNLLAILALYILPESPIWLMGNSNDPQDLYFAEKSLHQIRASSNTSSTLLEITRLVEEKDHSCFVFLDHPLFYRPLRLVVLLVFLYQSTFLNVFCLFGQPLPALLEYFDRQNQTESLLQVGANEALYLGAIQLTTLLLVAFVLVIFFERRTLLLTCGVSVMLLNTAQAVLVHSAGGHGKALSCLVYLQVAFSTALESLVWLSVAELPLHEYRVYTISVACILNWLLTALVLWVVHEFGKQGYLLIVSSLSLIGINTLLFFLYPNFHNRTTNEIIRQLLNKS